jgi:hypothetical protein
MIGGALGAIKEEPDIGKVCFAYDKRYGNVISYCFAVP